MGEVVDRTDELEARTGAHKRETSARARDLHALLGWFTIEEAWREVK